MRTLTTFLFLFLPAITIVGQQILPASEIDSVTSGDTICYTITNTGTNTAVLYPHIADFPGGEYAMYSQDSLVAWLLSHVTSTDTEERKLQAVQAIARLLKSPRFVNRLGIYDHSAGGPTVASKKFSLTGGLQSYHMQCGDYMRFGNELLIESGIAQPSELRECSFDGQHTLGEILYEGSWTKIDFDPGTAGFMTPNPNSLNGWASINNIVNDTNLLVESNRYLYGDSLDLCPGMTMSEYGGYFTDTPAEYYPVSSNSPADIGGTWKLCSNCEVSLKIPVIPWVYVDTSNATVMNGFTLHQMFEETSDSTYYYDMLDTLGDYLGITPEQAEDTLQHLTIEEPTFQNLLNGYYNDNVPTLSLYIPARSDTVRIGSDVRMPNIVTSVQTSGTMSLMDTLVPGSFTADLWQTDSSGLALSYEPTNSEVNYLTEGWIYSPDGPTVIELAFNPGMYPLGERDIVIDDFGQTVSLVVTTDCGNSGVITDLPNLSKTAASLNVYPNPTTGIIQISETVSYRLFSTSGEIVGQGKSNAINIDHLPGGIYFIKMILLVDGQVVTKKIIKQ